MPTTIQLRQEIFEADSWKIAEWLDEEQVKQYLNEGQNVSSAIKQTISRIKMPIHTHLFNRNGSFFMINKGERPIGFLRLVCEGDVSEIVVVIGDINNWGKGFGYQAIYLGLKHAFLALGKKKVIARIHTKNERSMRVFKKAGFLKEKNLSTETQFYISPEQFV